MSPLNSESMILCLDTESLAAWVAESACAHQLGGVPVCAPLEVLHEALPQADALFLLAGPEETRGALALAAEYGKDELLIFDFCEVKEGHLDWVDENVPLRLHYLSLSVFGFSLEADIENRFIDSTAVLVPSMATRPEALERALEFWGTLGSNVFQRLPHEHDALHAAGAQAPLLVAGAYLSALTKLFENPAELQAMSIPELQLFSDLALGLDVDENSALESNRENIVAILTSLIGELNELKDRFASQRAGKTAGWTGRTRENALGFAQDAQEIEA